MFQRSIICLLLLSAILTASVKPAQGELYRSKRPIRRNIPVTFEDVKKPSKGALKLLPNHNDCGAQTEDRIFYGNVTTLGQYPWMVVIKYINANPGENQLICGGSLISMRYVLSAAHCIKRNITAEVRVGEWDMDTNPDCFEEDDCIEPVQDIGIEKILLHVGFRRKISEGGKVDLALLRLEREATPGYNVAPICLPISASEGLLRDGEMMYVAGWGMTEELVASSKKLFTVLHNVPLDECRRKINAPLIKLDQSTICALGKAGRDACQGDSGGPLMTVRKTDKQKERYFLNGVVSRALSCGALTKPGFYMDVYDQLEWIMSNMEP